MSTDTYGPNTYDVGVLNAPTTTNKHGKANLLAPALRVKAMLGLLRERGVTACGLVEVGTITRVVLRLHPGWIYLPTAPNTVTPINRKGNAILLRRKPFKVVARKGLRVVYPRGFRERLMQPRVLTEDKVTHRQNLWVVAHAPRKTEPIYNRLVLRKAAKACKAGYDAGLNVVCMVDTNNLPGADKVMLANGMRRVASVDVMAIYVSNAPYVKRLAHGVVPAEKITDHGGLVWARLEFTSHPGFDPVSEIPEP